MIKRTLYFGNPCYLSVMFDQLRIRRPSVEEITTIPIEDIGVVLLDHQQITITHEVLRRLQDNNTAIISCDKMHMPKGLLLPLEGNHTQTQRHKIQLNASEVLKKQLWQQTIVAKLDNQKSVLAHYGKNTLRLKVLMTRVKSGDSTNIEAQAAKYYWATLFTDFIREREGEPPNNYLNYGYAVLRSMVARALIKTGLLPTIGIFHKNKYNPFCLADDIMEPYRPFVDVLVSSIFKEEGPSFILTNTAKRKLLSIATMDALYGNKRSPLMVGLSRTTSSLFECFEGKRRKIIYPTIPENILDSNGE